MITPASTSCSSRLHVRNVADVSLRGATASATKHNGYASDVKSAMLLANNVGRNSAEKTRRQRKCFFYTRRKKFLLVKSKMIFDKQLGMIN